jgi:hypothetical protein
MGYHRFLRLPGEHSISKAVDDPRSAERALFWKGCVSFCGCEARRPGAL